MLNRAICCLDRGVNTFSPEGRLFQGTLCSSSGHQVPSNTQSYISVEYAIEAIKVRFQNQLPRISQTSTMLLLP